VYYFKLRDYTYGLVVTQWPSDDKKECDPFIQSAVDAGQSLKINVEAGEVLQNAKYDDTKFILPMLP